MGDATRFGGKRAPLRVAANGGRWCFVGCWVLPLRRVVDPRLPASLTRRSPAPPERYCPMEHVFEIDVRYYETDGQGVVHHSNYFRYFELARVEMLKAMGHDYQDLERDGVLLVVHSISAKYHRPAKFGDRLRIETKVVKATMARIEHAYRVVVNGKLIAEGASTIACVDRDGNIRRMPEHIIGE
jgi:acyl-CoA thioester hydrolase